MSALTKCVVFEFHHVTHKQRAEETNVNVKPKPSSDFALVRLINFCNVSAIIVLVKFSYICTDNNVDKALGRSYRSFMNE